MLSMKRTMTMLALLAALLAPTTRLLAAPEHAAEAPTAAAAAEKAGAHAADAAGHGEHGEHVTFDDNRLVPIMPGNDTLIAGVWVIIIFVIMLVILYPTAWKNVLAGLKAREERIRKDIADAESANAKAQSALKEYQSQLAQAEGKVREILAQAAADAEKLAAGIKLRSQQEAEEIKERANKEIEASKNQALSEIYAQTAQLSTSIAEKILRRNLNAADQQDLVARSLEQLQGISKN